MSKQPSDLLRAMRLRWQNPRKGSAEAHDPQGTLRAIRRQEALEGLRP